MLKPEIHIDSSSGFCFGVVYAIELAEEILKQEGSLYCLGDIVHNDEEIRRLKSLGLKIINHEELGLLRDSKVLIRAHGEPPSTYKTAMENNLELIDASCPVVLKLQNRVKLSADQRRQILIYGKRGHAEVEGLLGQTRKEAIVFLELSELDLSSLPEQITLYSQTTKSTRKFYEAYQELLNAGFDVDLNDTTCRQVSNRDKQLQEFAGNYNVILFVSGKKSSNGKVLYDVCKSVNEHTYFLTGPDELNIEMIRNRQRIGICGATSTPMWLMEEVRARAEELIRHSLLKSA